MCKESRDTLNAHDEEAYTVMKEWPIQVLSKRSLISQKESFAPRQIAVE